MNREFRLVVAVWQAEGEINFLEDGLKAQVEQAIEAYNKRYGGFKKLQLIEITKSTIVLKLTVVVPENEKVDVSRAIAYFSKQLYHQHGWSRFSKVEKRLFTVVESEEITTPEVKPHVVCGEESAVYQVPGRTPDVPMDSDMKAARLKWLYATRDYIDYEIKKLEADGVRLRI